LLNIPFAFEKYAKDLGLNYKLQDDDIVGMLDNSNLNLKDVLEWTGRVIRQQFEDIVELVEDCDIFIAANTEFAAPTIAEYVKRPFIRTAYAPLLPSRKIMPPVTPLVKQGLLLRPWMVWRGIAAGMNMMSKKPLNKWRVEHNLKPIPDHSKHAPAQAHNYLMFSPSLGEVDKDWKWRWSIGGYCFNDVMPYDDLALKDFLYFVQKDSRPTLFFTLGSINGIFHERLAGWVYEICRKYDYKLVIGCGWWKVGHNLQASDDLYLLDKVIPHRLILPHCDAIIHHGGSGTTHSACRAGKPQIVVPHVIDQHYWARRTMLLGAGSGAINIRKIKKPALEKLIVELMTNKHYKKNAAELGERIRAETGLDNIVRFIEGFK